MNEKWYSVLEPGARLMTIDPEHEARRVFLVNKMIDAGLTNEEDAELDRLQKEAGRMKARPIECRACRERGKTWSGSEPKCAFVGAFRDNWNCATLNAIRRICDPENPRVDGVDHHYCEDQHYATIKIHGVEIDDQPIGLALWVSWYKSRGRTDAAWVLDEYDAPRPPTEAELVAVARFYGEIE